MHNVLRMRGQRKVDTRYIPGGPSDAFTSMTRAVAMWPFSSIPMKIFRAKLAGILCRSSTSGLVVTEENSGVHFNCGLNDA